MTAPQQVVRRPMYPAGCTDVATLGTVALRYDMDAQTVLSDGTAISTITDTSGNSRNATATGSARPLYKVNVLNGKPGALGDGANSRMPISGDLSFLQSQYFTILIVAKITTNISANTFFGGSNGTVNSELRLAWSDTTHLFFGQYINDLTSSSTSVNTSGEVYTFESTSTGKRIWQNTTQVGSNADTTQLAGTASAFLMHSDLTGGSLNGTMLDIVMFVPALSAGNLTSAQNALKCKYGL